MGRWVGGETMEQEQNEELSKGAYNMVKGMVANMVRFCNDGRYPRSQEWPAIDLQHQWRAP